MKKTNKTTRFEVRPRYTGGSPGLVSEAQALRVVREEKDAYRHAMEGAYGDKELARAKRLGLHHIAFTRTEVRRLGWLIADLITGEERSKPFTEKITGAYATHPNTGQRVEVEVKGEDPDDHYHCMRVRSPWDGEEWSAPRWEIEYTTGRRKP